MTKKKDKDNLSRLGKMPVTVPGGVEVTVKDGLIRAKGPKGQLEKPQPPSTSLTVEDGKVVIATDGIHPNAKAFHGLARSLVQNLVTGVHEGFKKELQLQGVGYRAQLEGKTLILALGYSHPIRMDIPAGLEVEVLGRKQEEIVVSGADRELLGEWVAQIRRKRPPEPYKGKGVRFKGEQIKLKAGKRVGA